MRIDKYLSERFGSRNKAAESVVRGEVLVNGKKVKPSAEVSDSDRIEYVNLGRTFVSNGGYKLERALEEFGVDVREKVFADIGASTGGFTDCLLQFGAKRVIAVDVGENLLHPSLCADSRIRSIEHCNARYLTADQLGEVVDGAVADVSFISLKHILNTLYSILPEGGILFTLIKPQFECENRNIGKSGIVADKGVHRKIIAGIYDECERLGFGVCGLVNAPLREKKNVEYVLYCIKGAISRYPRERISEVVHNPKGR